MMAAALGFFAVLLVGGSFTRTPTRLVDPHTPTETSVGTETSLSAPTRRRITQIAPVLVALAIAVLVDPLIGLVALVSRFAWPRVRSVLEQRHAQHAIDEALPDAIEMLILVVHAGMTPHQAIALLETSAPLPTQPAFAEVRRRIERGQTLADALGALVDVLGPAAAVVADTLAMAERYGTPIGRALEQLADDVRERRRRRAEGEARKLPIRLSFPLVACTLPSFVLIAIIPAVLAAIDSLGGTGF